MLNFPDGEQAWMKFVRQILTNHHNDIQQLLRRATPLPDAITGPSPYIGPLEPVRFTDPSGDGTGGGGGGGTGSGLVIGLTSEAIDKGTSGNVELYTGFG